MKLASAVKNSSMAWTQHKVCNNVCCGNHLLEQAEKLDATFIQKVSAINFEIDILIKFDFFYGNT